MKDNIANALSRGEFLRASAIGTGGLGLAVLTSGGPTAEAAPPETRRGYVVAVTHGPSDPTRVMLALFTATRLPTGDNHVWFAIDGGPLCKKGEAEKVTSPLFTKQGDAAKMLANPRKGNGDPYMTLLRRLLRRQRRGRARWAGSTRAGLVVGESSNASRGVVLTMVTPAAELTQPHEEDRRTGRRSSTHSKPVIGGAR